ncbi:MAG: hypothetical protein A2176_07430 [Spirochaetes bacterium RBG_13_51_14]|nr:MAG: hypothetical protein A2176_07430 [Spirochaetes bacterium RBG_13_51_14]
MLKAYQLNGIAIAVKIGTRFRICACRNLFNNIPGLEFSFTEPDIISVSDPGHEYIRDNLLYIPDFKRQIILIISPAEKNQNILSEIQYAADLLSISMAFQKKQASLLDKYRNYLNIFQKSPNLTAILNTRGEVVEWNEAAEQLYGRELSSGPVSYLDFIHEDEITRIRENFAGLYRNCENFRKTLDPNRMMNDPSYRETSYERIMQMGAHQGLTKLTSRSGDKSLVVDYTVSLIFDPETLETSGCIVTTTDITHRKELREQMEESERKYRDLFKLIPLFSMLIDTSGKTVDFNYISSEDYDLNSMKFDGISYMDFIHRDDQKRAATLFIDLYTKAIHFKNQWIKDATITKEECALKLRSLRINNEPLRLVSGKRDHIFETEFTASLWISESNLEIKGALLSAIDVTERNNYRRRLEESEKKYRELVEEKTRDIIFSLDGKARFVMVNSNIREKLGYPEDAIIGNYIIDILYKDPNDKNQINRETFLENIDRVLKNKKSDVRFKAVCDHKFLGEPVTLQFKLDPIMENGEVIGVMGFASEISDDPLREYLEEETLSFTIDNRLTIADEVSFRITRNLRKYLNHGKMNLLRLGLREMIINAIEHGNLGITYEEKTTAQKNQSYHDLLQERQMSEENKHKKVYIEYKLCENTATYTIRDEGAGFDHEKFFKLKAARLNEQMAQHGRGILITRSIFDDIRYNERGNQVMLVAHFQNM